MSQPAERNISKVRLLKPLRAALRALEQRRREDDLKLKALRIQIKAGIDAIKRGDFIEIEEVDLEGHLERLTAPHQRAR